MVQVFHVVIMVDGCVCDLDQLEQRIFSVDLHLATRCSVFVQLCFRKTHLLSGVEDSIQSVPEAKEEGLGACQQQAPTVL